MKVVFLEDVPNIARAGEMKEVADGYGRNFLIPRKLAVLAGSPVTSEIEAKLKKRAHLQAQTEAEMRELAGQLEGKEIILKARAGATDRLYGSITNTDIAEELEKSARLVVDKRKIELDEPIREVGSYEIAIRLTKDIVPKIKLTVLEEEKKEGKEEEKKAEGTEEKKRSRKKKVEKVEAKGQVEKEGAEEKKRSKKKKVEKVEAKGQVGKEEAGEKKRSKKKKVEKVEAKGQVEKEGAGEKKRSRKKKVQ